LVKVSAQCGYCLIRRAVAEIENITDDEQQKFYILRKIFRFFSHNFSENSIPSNIGTIRDRIIREISKKDPYYHSKKRSNQIALKFVPKIEKEIEKQTNNWNKFRTALLCSIVGNIIEFDIEENKNPLGNLELALEQAEADLTIDQSKDFYELVKKSDTIIYLTDNAGEIVFDKIFIKELSKLCKKIIVIVKGIPVLNDATMEDAEFINLTSSFPNVEVIPSGTDHVGMILEETPKKILDIINSGDLIIAKGMGYFETLTEYELKKPVVHLFRIKCGNISKFLNREINKNVILIR